MDNRTGRILSYVCIFVVSLQIMLRLLVNGDVASFGENMLVHSLIWAAVAVWLLSSTLKGGFTFRFTGLEIPFVVFAVMCVVSYFIAAYKQPAALYGFAYLSYMLLFIFVVNFFDERTKYILFSVLSAMVFTLVVYSMFQYYWLFDIAREEFRKNPNIANLPPELRKEFEWRLAGDEVFSTFVLSNSFAGFLVVFIPLILGATVDLYRRLKENVSSFVLIIRVCLIAISLYAFYLTGSKGGTVAFVSVIAVFIGYFLLRNYSNWRKVVTLIIPALLLLAIVLMASGLVGYVLEKDPSTKIRSTYWDSALNTIKNHLIVGVGISNYADYHTIYKSEEQNEVTKVHNDYLQITAETGLIGLLAFLSIWIILFMKVIWSSKPPELASPLQERNSQAISDIFPYTKLLVPIAFFIALILAYKLTDAFNDLNIKPEWKIILYTYRDEIGYIRTVELPSLGLILFGFMLVYFFINYKQDLLLDAQGTDRTFTKLGMAAGLVGFLVHIIVDFDFYVFGVSEMIFVVMALLILVCGKGSFKEIRVGRWLTSFFALVAVIILIPIIVILNRVMVSGSTQAGQESGILRDAVIQLQRGNLWEGRLEPEWEFNERGQPIKQKGTKFIDGASKLFKQAAELNPIDIRPYLELGGINYREFKAKAEAGNYGEAEKFIQPSIYSIKKAISVRSANFQLRSWLGDYLYDFSKMYEKIGRRDKQEEYFRQAFDAYKEAKEHYPTRAQTRWRYGKMLEESGKQQEAFEEYKIAIHLNKKANEAQLDRLMLIAEIQDVFRYGKTLESLGRKEEMVEAYRSAVHLDEVIKEKNRREKTNVPTISPSDLGYAKERIK
ncbi:MAG: hypothetical protein A2W23_09680 [Planctomycetes bacterium RBG_16_43_13]|nr:MAG: hypothetical protein A2W23_09680 [Planctomycetes bacterium RBG_16_43_13]